VEVGLDGRRLLVADQQGTGVQDDDRVVVDVHGASVRVYSLGDGVDIVLGGQPSAEVEELADAVPGEVGDRPAEEGPVGPRPGHGPTTPAGAGPGHGSRASRAISSVTWR
jgi:hypothetical protein